MSEASIAKVLFTFGEAAEMTGLRESWLRKAVASQAIAHRKVGKHVRFSRADIDALVDGSAVTPAPSGPARRRSA